MKVGTTSSRNIETREVKVRVTVTDAAPRLRYAGSRRMWQPERAVITWVSDRVNGGGWSAWAPQTIMAIGRYLRADGSPSKSAPVTEPVRAGTLLGERIIAETRPPSAAFPPVVNNWTDRR